MKNIDTFGFHPTVEKLVDILCSKTQNYDRTFFRMMVSYYFAKIASMMRVKVHTEGIGTVPVNAYIINLATSGSGKGRSMNIMEEQVLSQFRDIYLSHTFELKSEETISKLAVKRANRAGVGGDPELEKDKLLSEFEAAGHMVFSFDSGTSAAVKQMRHKLLLAGSGSMNMEIDEIGSNLLSNMDALNTFLELYDVGKIKQKLVKHTKENARNTELFGMTPANMLLFGTPVKLLDGSKAEEQFYDMLDTGFARRCFYGYSKEKPSIIQLTPEQLFNTFTDTASEDYLLNLAAELAKLADLQLHGAVMQMDKDVTLKLLEYRLYCEKRAEQFSEYEDMRKAEMKHRYFKTAKMAAIYAFVDQSLTVTEKHLEHAIALAEASGHSFDEILRRDRPYVKLASYIATINREVTEADLIEDLPFYKGSESNRRDIMKLAIAHGYQNSILITYREVDDIKFYQGKTLAKSSLDAVILSHSVDLARAYQNRLGKWQNIVNLCTANDHHWSAHRFLPNPKYPEEGGYRAEEFVEPGFNLVVIDVDGQIDVFKAMTLLQEYTWFIHTTKSHTETSHRFRIIMPMSHIYEASKEEYKAFMLNVFDWLPFDSDKGTTDRSRKWETYPGDYWFNEGELLNTLQFVANGKLANERKAKHLNQTNLTKIERWFVNQAEEGNRNNLLFRYGVFLAEAGHDLDNIKNNILALNDKLEIPLEHNEILGTIMVSVSKKYAQINSDA